VLRREEGETFGFRLRVERGRQGHIIRQLNSLGVAERSGLKDGDHLLEVNEKFVDNVEHMEVRSHDLCFAIMFFYCKSYEHMAFVSGFVTDYFIIFVPFS
jgi:hypothetical protein